MEPVQGKVSTVSDTSPVGKSAATNAKAGGLSSLSQRLIVSTIIIAIGTTMIMIGGWVFMLLILTLLCVSAWEYWRLFHAGGLRPSAVLLIGGVFALAVVRFLWGFQYAPLVLTLCVLISMAISVFDYRAAEKTAVLDFNLNLGGLLYLGWLGSYMISLRALPDGVYWLMLVIPATALCDAGAFFIGSRLGKRKMAPIISPKKTWEGYAGGVLFGILGGTGLASAWHLAAPAILPWHGLVIGAAVSLLTPLGDLGESMIKRGFGFKDSGTLLPGHGGMMDRIDSWLWAAPIGYYLIFLFFVKP
jgi:phosphatidate cytidylyltransferase